MEYSTKVFTIVLFTCLSVISMAQSPTDLLSNINLPDDVPNTYTNSSSGAATFTAASQVIAAFNYGRRQEEIQLGLPTNSLGDLSLPAGFSTATPQEQSLYIINQERIARAGKSYPGSPLVLGIPLTGLETNLTGLAQGHAEDMVNNGFFGHIGSNGDDPFERISGSSTYPATCQNTTFGYAENIYRSCSFSSVAPAPGALPPPAPFLAAQAIYTWLYRDAGTLWGHRRAILIQNTDPYLSGTTGYGNDYGQASSEGFLGIGTYSVVNYASCVAPAGFYNTGGYVVVMNVADPVNDANCPYDLQETPLPVKLISFSVSKEQRSVIVQWLTSEEANSASFEIQHSLNAKTWLTIGSLTAGGNTNTKRGYEFYHLTPANGENLYRLKMIDRDGTFAYSHIRSLYSEGSPETELAVYPNPASNELLVHNPGTVSGLTIWNNGGQLVLQSSLMERYTGKLSIENLKPDIYVVKITRKNGSESAHKILVTK